MLAWLRAITRRITPTCVGRTTRGTRTGRSSADHPHVRGEDPPARTCSKRSTGSPPRAWGGPTSPDLFEAFNRITPTCVGRTGRQHLVCRGMSGSPPRAWGGPTIGEVLRRLRRITPTCVGRTPPPRRPGVWAGDHPHVRGEDASSSSSARRTVGSPPRAWGGRPATGQVPLDRRITPTCVGRTRGTPCRSR